MKSRMDSNEDGALTKAEIDDVDDEMLTDEVPKTWAVEADANKDGSLTWEEWLAFKSPPLQEQKQEL